VTPTFTPLLPPLETGSAQLEIVLFVGYPAIGKTTFFHRIFAPVNYTHVNQDKLGNRKKCLEAVADSIRRGESCVVDNTNRDKKTRKYYVELAVSLGVSIRCFVFQASIELAWHNNLYRSFCQPPADAAQGEDTTEERRKMVPYAAFAGFKAGYEEPSALEGFQEIKYVNWSFTGDNREKEAWKMWLQVDGK